MSFGAYFLMTLILAGGALIILVRTGRAFFGGLAALLILWGAGEFWIRAEGFDAGIGIAYYLPASITAFVMVGGLLDLVMKRWQIRPSDDGASE